MLDVLAVNSGFLSVLSIMETGRKLFAAPFLGDAFDSLMTCVWLVDFFPIHRPPLLALPLAPSASLCSGAISSSLLEDLVKECRRLIFFSPSEGVFPQNFFFPPLEAVSVLDLGASGLEGKAFFVVVVGEALFVVAVVVVACSPVGGMKGWWMDLGPGSIG